MRLLDDAPRPDFDKPSMRRARAGVLLGLLFLSGPLADLSRGSYAPARLAALLLGLAAFVGLYVSLLPPARWLMRLGPAAELVAFGLLPVIATALLIGGAPASFAALYVYFVAAAGMRIPERAALAVTGLTALAVCIAGLVHGSSDSAVAATVLTIVSIGVLMTAFGRIARANRELRATRKQLARLAVSEERLRIARDLHDLLGHSLSVIALKSELAGKLVEREPAKAIAELADIQTVTRTALAEVREAVQGYRRLALAEALESARGAGFGRDRLRAQGHRRSAAGRGRCRARLGGARGNDQRDPPQSRVALSHSRRRRRRAGRARDRGRRQRRRLDEQRQRPQRPARARRPSSRRAGGRRKTGRRFPPAAERAARGNMIRVLIAEDQAMVRGALASLLALEEDIEVVAEVSRGDLVVAEADRTEPDVVLLDIEMPGLDGIAAAGELARTRPETRTLILTTFGRPGYMRRALEQGASGFLLKDAPAGELAAAIRAVADGRQVLDATLAAQAIREGESPLTPREHDVLAAAVTHDSAAEIAAALHLSEGTVRNYLSAAIRKLGVRNRRDAIDLANNKGWL